MSRCLRNARTLTPGRGWTRQMALSAVCSSMNAPVAPRKRRHDSHHGREHARGRLGRAFDHRLHGLGPLAADQPLDLPDDLAPDGVGPEHEPRDPDRDDQDGREREQRVIRERGAEAGNIVVPPPDERVLEHPPERPGGDPAGPRPSLAHYKDLRSQGASAGVPPRLRVHAGRALTAPPPSLIDARGTRSPKPRHRQRPPAMRASCGETGTARAQPTGSARQAAVQAKRRSRHGARCRGRSRQ